MDLADKSYLDTLEKVFILYEHAIASGVWIDEDLVKLCEYAEAIKCFEKQSRKREARPPVFYYFRQFQQCKLDATLPLPLNDLPHQWDFNGVGYIKKLIQPALRAIELYRLSKRSTFRKMFKGRSLNITGVRAGDHGIRRSGSINIDAICKLIHEIPSQPEDQETLIAQIRAALHHTDGNIVLRSHPECNLLRYHDGGRPYVERPFPYIATNKMPCIACGHFVHYHRHLVQWESKEQVGFFLRGWKDRIELDWCFPATDPDHIYSRQIGIQMHNGLVKVLRKRMDVMRKYRAIQERKQSSRW
ncbi:hypothetical protein VNI00_006592 [Paramarasmius palmivorus]|uniref:Uncharacterized protein n=1 Tax=Paramarasmius palmivorus TaxID=297713 RepID=A0AAW0D4F7_9AGAR